MDWEIIEGIPLSTMLQEDFWAWHYEKSGVFTVRSAYRMLVRTRVTNLAWEEDRPSNSEAGSQEKEWSELWKIKVPSKIRVFLWRLARHSVPTSDVRHHRNMATDGGCSLGGADDSWRHALLECNLARCVWALEREEITEFLCQVQCLDARAWLAEVMRSLKHEEFTRVVVRLWAIWYVRRKAIHENYF
jgi:hypothetical protein